MLVYLIHVCCLRSPEESIRTHGAGSLHVDAVNQTQVLWKTSQCNQLRVNP